MNVLRGSSVAPFEGDRPADEVHGTLDIQSFIDGRRLSAFQLCTIILCIAILVVDGFDAVMIAYMGPAIGTAFGIKPAQLGPLFGAGLFGLTVGAFLAGSASDRFGRRLVVLVSVAVFGVFTCVSAFSASLSMLVLFRFLAGLGLGGAGPSAMALISELSPRRNRALQIALLGCGIPLGGGIAGFVAAHVIPAHGWQGMCVVGGVVPLLLLIVLVAALPDSVRYLVVRGTHDAQNRVRVIMRRIEPRESFDGVSFVAPSEASSRAPVGDLFRHGFAPATLLLWLGSFCMLMVMYFLTNWLPILIKSTGHSMSDVALLMSLFLLGSPLGSITIGLLTDRLDRYKCVATAALIATLCFLVIGNEIASPFGAALIVLSIGASLGGATTGFAILAAFIYPTAVRGTGLGWTAGWSRLGSVVGSMIGGVLLAQNLGLPTLLRCVAFPCAAAAACFLLLRYVHTAAKNG